LAKAVGKIYDDYLKYYKILQIKGGFALLYPKELTRPMPIRMVKELANKLRFRLVAIFSPDDGRGFTVSEGTLPEIADFISKHVLTPPVYLEPNVEYMIKTLRDATSYIVNGLRHLAGGQLEDIFGGKDVFKNILQYEEREYPVEDMRIAAAYLLLNQLLFYHVLSRHKPDEFPEIDTDLLRSAEDIKIKYFNKVPNYAAIFSYDVASKIPAAYIDIIKTTINVIKGLAPEKIKTDLLGMIFHDLIPFEIRKSVAAFYTNIVAAELLACLAIDDHDAKVADFAVGSGGLLVAAYRRKKQLLKEKREFREEDHRKFVEEDLLGIDVMPFAAHLAATHLALQAPEYLTNKVKIAIWDSTDLSPNRYIPPIASLEMVLTGQTPISMFFNRTGKEKGVVKLEERGLSEEIKLDYQDVIIMNPPFTRQERIPKEYKEKLFQRFKKYKNYLHKQLSYYGYFILLADKFIKDGGRMALVLPATFLRVNSAEGIRRLLIDNYHIEYIITTWQRAAFSEGAQFREILLIAKKTKVDNNAKCGIVLIKKLPKDLKEARELANKIKFIYNSHNINEGYEDETVSIRILNYGTIRNCVSNMFIFIALTDLNLLDLWMQIKDKGRPKFSTFSDYLTYTNGKIIRGVEEWSGRDLVPSIMFILRNEKRVRWSSDRWIVNKLHKNNVIIKDRCTGIQIKIPKKVLTYGVRRPSVLSKIDISKELDYIICDTFENIDTFSKIIKIDSEKLDKMLIQWKDYVERRKCNLLLNRRFDISAPGTALLAFYSNYLATPTNIFWSIKGIHKEDAKILSLWFNSTLNILQILLKRKETRGAFLELDKYITLQLIIIDPRKLTKSEVDDLIELYDKIKDVAFPSILQQLKTKHPTRVELDMKILNILGFNKRESRKILEHLYAALTNEIEKLKKIMQG